MNTQKNIWNRIIDFENLYTAWKRASRGKRYTNQCLEFSINLEQNLIQLQNELITKTYKPSPLREFWISDPKRRQISAPDFRDRVVQHALMCVIEPCIDTSFIYDTHACRKNHGVHLAINRLQRFTRQAKKDGAFWYFKGDIKSYFPSIPHLELKGKYKTKISDSNALWLINLLIDTFHPGETGIPIGALLSQLSANIYLDSLDHYVKDVLGIKKYVRYMDDFIIISNSKSELNKAVTLITLFIKVYLKLTMNPKSGIGYGLTGIPFCGYRVYPTHITIRKRSLRRSARHLRKLRKIYSGDKSELVKIRASIMSFSGHLSHCSAYLSRTSVINRIILRRRTKDD